MKRTQQLLDRTTAELQSAVSLLKAKRLAQARASSRRERQTAKLERRTIEKAVKEINTHRDILKDGGAM